MASKNTTLDRYDRRILEFLQQDGSLSNIELAEKVGLSPSPCSRRVQKLEEQGYISHRIAVLNQKKLGLDLTAIIQINIDKHTPERLENFEEKIRALPEVQQCYLITGQSADYVLQVVVPDMEAYQHFLLNKITRIDGVTGVHSSFVMRKVVDSIAIPLDHLK
ncbi:MAG TPA: Lrp/AsnC family transcriptional regulator [Alcanivoracaceae bacterium]|nr:Lrp/AsnC family transcriptional regulator [Alcanivoracaceae bacterium]